jgi:uncharacterized protein YmfQ (DUF2313 family)
MNHAELLKRLLPPVAYDGNGTVISAELNAEGDALDAALLMADGILREADPRITYSLFPDWERVAGLSALNLSLGQRHSILTAKLASRGGQSRPYYIAMAERFGFPGATIDEFKPATCNSNCNAALYGEPDRFVWQMNLPSAGGMFIANCNSPCNTPLGSWGTGAAEAAIRAARPAHTTVIFVNT